MERISVTPLEYVEQTGKSYQEIADLCDLDYQTVKRWFIRAKSRTEPSKTVCRLLAMDLELNELKRQQSASQVRNSVACVL